MRILVTGPRDWTNGYLIAARLIDVSHEHGSGVTLIEGGAKGFDCLSRLAAELFGWTVETYKPNYSLYARWEAPFLRNQTMVDTGANVCVTGYLPCVLPNCKKPQPHGTHGTADCVDRAKKAGIAISTIHGIRP